MQLSETPPCQAGPHADHFAAAPDKESERALHRPCPWGFSMQTSTLQCLSQTYLLRPLSLYTFVKLTLVRSSAAGVLISSILQAGSHCLSDASQAATAWATPARSDSIWSSHAVPPCKQCPPVKTVASLPKHGLAYETHPGGCPQGQPSVPQVTGSKVSLSLRL